MRPSRVSHTIPTVTPEPPRLPFRLSAVVGLLPISRAATLYQKTKSPHLPLSTPTLVIAGITVSHAHARSKLFLAMTRPFYVRDYSNAMVWDKKSSSSIGSDVVSVVETAARETPTFCAPTWKQPRPSRVITQCPFARLPLLV